MCTSYEPFKLKTGEFGKNIDMFLYTQKSVEKIALVRFIQRSPCQVSRRDIWFHCYAEPRLRCGARVSDVGAVPKDTIETTRTGRRQPRELPKHCWVRRSPANFEPVEPSASYLNRPATTDV